MSVNIIQNYENCNPRPFLETSELGAFFLQAYSTEQLTLDASEQHPNYTENPRDYQL